MISYEWRGAFENDEWHRLHAEAFETRLFDDDWKALTERVSMGWVVARDGAELVGFVNVLWDGLVHAWIQDVMVRLEWLHVDFDEELQPFYFDACGFTPTNAGLISLQG